MLNPHPGPPLILDTSIILYHIMGVLNVRGEGIKEPHKLPVHAEAMPMIPTQRLSSDLVVLMGNFRHGIPVRRLLSISM